MKLWFNRVLDFILWMAFCLMLSTGLILRYRLPPGSRGGAGLSIWTWSRHEWGDLHTWLGYVVCLAVIVHLALHWRWLWRCAVPRWRWPVLVGILAGLLLMMSVWLLPVEHSTEGHHGSGRHGLGSGQGAGRRHNR